MARVDARDGDDRGSMERLMSVAAIDEEFRRHGHCLLVDMVSNDLVTWGLPRSRPSLLKLVTGREEEMKRFLIARALREER